MINETLTLVINGSQAIPLEVTTITKTNWIQFGVTIAASAFFILWMLGQSIGEGIGKIISKVLIYSFKKANKVKHLMVIKHTRSGMFDMSMINQETMRELQEAMLKFKGENFDLVLYTGGGEIFSSEFISRLLRSYKGKIRTFVPVYSMSGGTYLALSTNEIYMNDYSCLGAVDAQLGMLFGGMGSAKGWSEVIKLKKNKANDQSIIMNLMGKQYTKTARQEMDNLLLHHLPNSTQRKVFVDYITSGEVQHALPLTKATLRSFGLKIKDIDSETNTKLLKLLKGLKDGVTYG